jgi:hypothetical protein
MVLAIVLVLPPAKTIIRGGSTCFAHDVVGAAVRRDACGRELVLTDNERLVAFVLAVSEPFFVLKSFLLRLTF